MAGDMYLSEEVDSAGTPSSDAATAIVMNGAYLQASTPQPGRAGATSGSLRLSGCGSGRRVLFSGEADSGDDADDWIGARTTWHVPLVVATASNLNRSPSPLRYALTECDEEGGRWRVQVPRSARCQIDDRATCGTTRIDQCRTSCKAGWSFDIAEPGCRPCRNGTYSLGGGLVLDRWDGLPDGFTSEVEPFRSSFPSRTSRVDLNCSAYGWQPRGRFLASRGGPCAATLTYTVHLVKAGNLTYTYQHPDKEVIFDFQAQNAQCQNVPAAAELRWPQYTQQGEWRHQTVALRPGQNVLQWKTLGMVQDQSRPVLIRSIEITGVTQSSACVPCPAGTFSDGGSHVCSECPENYSSERGASSCRPCRQDEYAPRGSSRCIPRLPCTHNDYVETSTPCREDKQTQRIFQWISPKICREDLAGAVSLPLPSSRAACPPCNPGMHYQNAARCLPCPPGTWTDGSRPCEACPAATTPDYGVTFTRWDSMPEALVAACLETDGSRCAEGAGWQPAGNRTHTGRAHSPGAYLLLSLAVAGFRSRGGVSAGHRMEVGRVSFSFQLDCAGRCEFVFLQATESKGVTLVQNWVESSARQDFSYAVLHNDSYTFSWAFQWTGPSANGASGLADAASIFSINVTNTIDGGAAACLPCHQETDEQGCIPCPAGMYVDTNSTVCEPCPEDTIAVEPILVARTGRQACQPCGPGLHSNDGISCTTDCRFIVNGARYDLNALKTPLAVRGSRLFTASGAQYYHMFNLSLCGELPAECSNSVFYTGEGVSTQKVSSFVCRTTVIPGQAEGDDEMFSTQSVTLGDDLVAVTTATSFLHMRVLDEFIRPGRPDLHFYYATPLATRSCPQGRTTIVTLRCDPGQPSNSSVRLPTSWPDGTSDGCNFSFLWSSVAACPLCEPSDYKQVRGECVNRQQAVHYLPAKHCYTPGSPPVTEYIPCSMHLPPELKIVVVAGVGLLFLLAVILLYFWKKTRSLEYKYMKLVQSAGREVDGELPPAESCALNDGEEEEVQFSRPPTAGILNRIIAMRAKGESGNPFETVQLTK